MLTAITRELNDAFADCELTTLPRVPIDTDLARRQHHQYVAGLESLGCSIENLPTAPGLADSVFIEDTALVLDEIAVLCRPGAASRRPEVAGVENALRDYRPLVTIRPPGTLDGGDLLPAGKTIFAGLSSRSNPEGHEQLQRILSVHGYTVKSVAVTGCLHLKSAVSLVTPGILLINPDWVPESDFEDFDLIRVDADEPHAANALCIGDSVIYPSSFPRTAEKLRSRGIEVLPVNVSELQKAEGGVTCCSLIVQAPPA